VLVLVAPKWTVEDLVRVAARDFDRAVGRVGIDNDDLVRPRNRFADRGDVGFFVMDDDSGGDSQFFFGFLALGGPRLRLRFTVQRDDSLRD
jgi:hypothetical protein